jgi:predicted nucleic acid-binding protein
MILVDTSVWIAYLRGTDRKLTAHLRTILEDDVAALAIPVRIEILSGSSVEDLPRLRRALSGLPLLVPSTVTWERMEAWIEKAVSKGERFGMGDLLIAAMAAERGMSVWSLDNDFARMQRLGFIQLHHAS